MVEEEEEGVVVEVGVSPEGEALPDDGVAEGAAAPFPALALTASFMPPLQWPGMAQMK